MKIGIFDPYLDSFGGGENYMLTAALCLSQKHEVTIFWDKDVEGIKKEAKRKFDFDLSEVKFEANIFSKDVSFIKRFNTSKKYDYILFLSDGSVPFLACKLLLHFQTPMQWLSPNFKTKLKVKRANRVICNSQFTKHFIDKKFGISAGILYPPVAFTTLYETKKENIILHVGRFGINHTGSSYKKQEVLLDTFKRMVDSGLKNWKLVFVASVMDSEKEKLADFEISFKDYPIKVVTNISGQEMDTLYSKAKIYWHASGYGEDIERHPDRAEHFGISTVEAMIHGAVPIVFKAGGQKEIVDEGENGYLWESIDSLIDKTRSIIDSQTLYASLSEKAQEKSKMFSKERFCQELQRIII